MSHYFVDTRGLKCPEPIWHLEDQIRQLSPLDTIELLASDPLLEPEMEEWCRRHGHYLIEADLASDGQRFVIEVRE